MKTNQINKVSLGVGWDIIWKAWDMAKVNYGLSVLISFIISFLFLIPVVREVVIGLTNNVFSEVIFSENVQVMGRIFEFIVSSFTTALVPVVYVICAFHWEKGEPYSLRQIIADLKDKKNIKLFFPVVSVSFFLSFVSWVLNILDNMVLTYIFTIITSMFTILLNFCYPILFFKPEIGLGKALVKSLQGTLKNILPFVIGLILMGFLLIVCAICLLLPVILVSAPVSISFYYLWYRVIFEDLKLESDEISII